MAGAATKLPLPMSLAEYLASDHGISRTLAIPGRCAGQSARVRAAALLCHMTNGASQRGGPTHGYHPMTLVVSKREC